MRRRREGGQDGEPRAATQRGSREAAARPPPQPLHQPASRGGPGPHPPRQGGWSPLPQSKRGAGARPAPPPQRPAPTGTGGDKRARANAPRRSTDRAQLRRASTNRSGMGGHAPHGQNDTSDTRFVACPGKAEGRNEAERPPALQAPPASANGGHGAQPPPPPQPALRHTNATDLPHGGRTAPSQVGRRPPTGPAARSPHRACRPRGHCRAPTTTRPRPQHVGSGPKQPAQWAGSRGRGSA